jgi:broad specificity phosphatase PhoE
MSGLTRRTFTAAAAVLSALPAVAEDAWKALRRPGTVAVMRHALAPGTGDPAAFTLGDCSTQRNLDARGRAQARAVGAAFRERDIRVDGVYTSRWCRCRETARLLDLGEPQDLPALDSFFRDRSTRDAQTRAVRRFLARQPQDARLVLVTHFVNIRALTGRSVRSGEIVVVDGDAAGAVEVLGEILIPT